MKFSITLTSFSHRNAAISFDVPLDGYSIEESTGSIQVCVIVSGAVSTAFTLTLTTQPITALGKVQWLHVCVRTYSMQ